MAQAAGDPDNLDWINILANLSPGTEFHNFAAEGHGPLWYDWVLKYILLNYPPEHFDTLIIQYTVSGRWILPLDAGVYFSDNQNSHIYFDATYITKNYIVNRCFPQRITLTRNRATAVHIDWNNERLKKKMAWISEDLDAIYSPDGLVTAYESHFTRLVKTLYGRFFNEVFCWDFSNTMFNADTVSEDFPWRNNIGWDVPFKNYLTKQYGLEYMAQHLFDDTFHCTAAGNRILANEYLCQSRIGDHLGLRHPAITDSADAVAEENQE